MKSSIFTSVIRSILAGVAFVGWVCLVVHGSVAFINDGGFNTGVFTLLLVLFGITCLNKWFKNAVLDPATLARANLYWVLAVACVTLMMGTEQLPFGYAVGIALLVPVITAVGFAFDSIVGIARYHRSSVHHG